MGRQQRFRRCRRRAGSIAHDAPVPGGSERPFRQWSRTRRLRERLHRSFQARACSVGQGLRRVRVEELGTASSADECPGNAGARGASSPASSAAGTASAVHLSRNAGGVREDHGLPRARYTRHRGGRGRDDRWHLPRRGHHAGTHRTHLSAALAAAVTFSGEPMKRSFTLGVILLLGACASNPHFEEANRLIAAGNREAALVQLEAAAKQNPNDPQILAALLRQRTIVVGEKIARGDAAMRAERFDDAEREYRAAVAADPDNQRAVIRLSDVRKAKESKKLMEQARAAFRKNDLAQAESRLQKVIAQSPSYPGARDLLRRVYEAQELAVPEPRLNPSLRKPVTLEFRDAKLRSVFDMLARTSGINFVFDRDVRQDSQITVFMRDTSLEDALKLILSTNQLDYKVLNQNSVLVYPNTPAKQKDYRELVVRSYYLSNADVKQAAAMVKSIAKTQDIFIDEKLNLMVVKDTPAAIRITDQLVRSLDLAQPEVMLEVEVLEISRTRLQSLGVQYPGSISLGTSNSTTTSSTTTTAGRALIDAPMFFTISDPAIVFNLQATVGKTNLLSNPRIRVKNREKANIMIGDKVPVFTSTAAANVGVSTSVSYLDVGLKLEVEPTIYRNDDVQIKLGLEVSNILEQVSSGGTNPSIAYRVGTRNANTVLQLHDGETQILGGLISDEDRKNSSRIPGLGDLPLLSRIFGSTTDNTAKTEIVLLITPRIVRNIVRPEGTPDELPFGTDASPGAGLRQIGDTKPGSLGVQSSTGTAPNALAELAPSGPAGVPPDAAAELSVAAPAQARLGTEFSLRVQAPAGLGLRDGFVEISYDPALVAPVGVSPPVPGRVQVPASALEGGVDVRFKALATAPASAQFAVANIELVDGSGFSVGMVAPPPTTVSLVQ
ncbi:MAG: tetratricopeptide repeat protein [Betaproteobacteria bacterium]|nr:tetratricopeptide repeat protein [Betaproteobacteria bacterium]